MRKQAQMTMRCMQALVRVQARVKARRLQLTHEKLQNTVEEHEQREREEQGPKPMSPMKRLDMDGWDNRRQSSQKIKQNDLRKHEAAMKRERALAYAFNYQQVSHLSLESITFCYLHHANPCIKICSIPTQKHTCGV